MTLTFELDLDIRPLDLHAKIQVRMFVCSPVRARHTHRHTDSAKTITPVAEAGCKNSPTIYLNLFSSPVIRVNE